MTAAFEVVGDRPGAKIGLVVPAIRLGRLPPRVKGNPATWSHKEASFHYHNLRQHLNGGFNLEIPKKMFFSALHMGEKLNFGRFSNVLQLEPGFAEALEQHPETLESELTEMSIEMQSLVPQLPWPIRLGMKTAQMAYSYSSTVRQMRQSEELNKPANE